MQNNSLLSELIYPLIVAIVAGVISSILQNKMLPNGFYMKLFKPIPDYVKDAGISTFLYLLSYRNVDIENVKPITSINKFLMLLFSLIIMVSIGCFSYYSFKIILNTPREYANLTLSSTDEWFVISENDARSYPDNNKWRLDQDACHTDIYQEISKSIGASYDLVYLICNSVGLDKQKVHIRKRVEKFRKDRNVVVFINIIFITYALFIIAIICAPITIVPKLIKYRDQYLQNKFLIK